MAFPTCVIQQCKFSEISVKIIQVEQELLDTQRKAGLPVHLPHDYNPLRLSTPQMTRRPTAVQPLLQQLGAEISEAEDSPDEDKTATVERKVSKLT